jgi:predicted metal-dependent peptidase
MARSDNWRINKSSLMAVEGAQILRALQKVAGAAGLPRDFQVRFSTKDASSGINAQDKELIIGGGRLFEEAPILADKFDVLVGVVLHEVGHWIIGTEAVWQSTSYAYRTGDVRAAKMFHEFVNIGEDIVVESRTRANPNLVDYEEALFKWATSKMREAHPNKLLELWIEYALGHKADRLLNLPPEMDVPMSELVALTGWLRSGRGHSTLDRAAAYSKYWEAVKEDLVLNPPKPPVITPPAGVDANSKKHNDGTDTSTQSEKPSTPAPDSEPEPEDAEGNMEDNAEPDNNEDGSGDGGEAGVGSDKETEPKGDEELKAPLTPQPEDAISNELAQAIEDAIQSDSEDITNELAAEFGNERIATPVIRSRETKTPLIKPNPTLCKRLERIMTIRKRLQSRVMHGEQYGRIDKRHLHRVGTDERIFNLRYKFPDGFPNTKILIDLSGSMSGKEADEVLEAAGALQTLVNAEVWCYSADKTVDLVRVDEGKLVHRHKPDGWTPSGLAIVGVSLGMRRGGLVIHLTDGGHNKGEDPWNAHWILAERGIELVNLIWGSDITHYRYDGMNYKQIDGLAEFPDALYQILIEKAKLRNIGGR